MDPTTLIALFMFLRRRGRSFDDMMPLLLLLASSGQGLFAGGSALVPVPAGTVPPVPGSPTPPPANNALLLLALLMGRDDGELSEMFRGRRREAREESTESRP